jgi:hypothetical protein
MTGPLLAVTATRGRAHAVADVAYLLPTSLDARPLGAQLSAVTPRLGWAYAFRCQRVCASAGARAGADVIWIRPTAASPAATATGSGTLVSPIVGARAALDARLGAVTIGLLLTVDVDLLGVRLVAEGAASQPVATAWRARPGLALTAGWR